MEVAKRLGRVLAKQRISDWRTKELNHALDRDRKLRYGPEAPFSNVRGNALMVDRLGSMRIEVRVTEHPPPHFHIIANGGDSSYSIETGEFLIGNLRLRRKVIHSWWLKNRRRLRKAWNDTRPSHCPVGHMKEPEAWDDGE